MTYEKLAGRVAFVLERGLLLWLLLLSLVALLWPSLGLPAPDPFLLGYGPSSGQGRGAVAKPYSRSAF